MGFLAGRVPQGAEKRSTMLDPVAVFSTVEDLKVSINRAANIHFQDHTPLNYALDRQVRIRSEFSNL